MKQTEILTHATQVNGWEPTVYMRLHVSKFPFVSRIDFIRSNLSNFVPFMYRGSLSGWLSGRLAAERALHHAAHGKPPPLRWCMGIGDGAGAGHRYWTGLDWGNGSTALTSLSHSPTVLLPMFQYVLGGRGIHGFPFLCTLHTPILL